MALSEGDRLLAISALQHVVYCERQAALIHVEQAWKEDVATAEGRVLHERADLPGADARPGKDVVRALPLCSRRLGLAGRADVVEYHEDATAPSGVRPFPVEYKRGRAKPELWDRVQLCAQALCLEEMHGVEVPRGAIYYGKSHRRLDVDFDEALRMRTEQAAARMHQLLAEGRLPAPEPGPKCKGCSLLTVCLPETTARRAWATEYLRALVSPKEGSE